MPECRDMGGSTGSGIEHATASKCNLASVAFMVPLILTASAASRIGRRVRNQSGAVCQATMYKCHGPR